ncbi:polysaccharide biosynthesis protein [Candidatus Parcubacteria bacterium]|nr:polysaccharide biosynthesis protein [Candidatus Parcubacteria bacterium]
MDIKSAIADKTILITGGTGSFGNAVAEKLLPMNPKKIIIFSRDEKKQFDMGNKFNSDKIRFITGDVRDKDSVFHATNGVDYVFHAAALKQVPNCEFFPLEAIKTNTLGAYNVIDAAILNNVKRVVILSTDKAVYPINAMGLTKALSERIMVAASREKRGVTTVCATRYGNVMATRGSVIPFFIEQMKAGKALTVTDKQMTRFLMPLRDSVDLVLYALVHGENGATYVRKSPASTMGDLAEALVEIFRYKKGVGEIGIRPGEKIHESLISFEETFRAEDLGEYYKIDPEVIGMDYRQYYVRGKKNNGLVEEGYTSANTTRLSVPEVKKLLLTLPEIKEEIKTLKK